MSGETIPNLPLAIALNGSEQMEAVQAGVSVRITTAQIATATGSGMSFSAGSTGFTPNTPSIGAVVLAGTLNAAHGGTGLTALGTGVQTALGLAVTGSGGIVLATTPTLTSPTFITPALGTPASGVMTNVTGLPLTTGVIGVLGAVNGGTAQSIYATGDMIYASASNTLAKLTVGSSGQVMTVAAGIPAWAAASSVGVTSFSAGTTGLTPSSPTLGVITLAGTLIVANGGTGLTAGTSGGMPYFASTSTMASSALLTASALVLGGGVGAAPTALGSLGTTTTVLHGNAAGAPTFGSVSLTADITGTLATNHGGTNLTSFTSGGAVYATSTSVLTTGTLPVTAGGTGSTQGPVLRSYLTGLTLSTAGGSSTFGIAAGVAIDSTNTASMALASAFTKTTSAWALGTGNGSLDTGAIANTTWYHAYLIQRVDTGVVDVLCSLSATTPTLPTNYTLFRRIGAMLTDGSAHWVLFTQNGDEFLWSTPTLDVAVAASTPQTAVSYTLSVPTGVVVGAMVAGNFQNTAAAVSALLSSLATADTLPAVNGIGVTSNGNTASTLSQTVRTNTSAQIRGRIVGNINSSLYLTTQGWIDRRGRDS